ncbi:MAG: type II toxin-antitoxin system VapC family toxin [Candidatus Nanohaloarchaea archaeon]|nr:type II toxin-antitoxin system VapC family toxin [Candidatus Nanohaloarchaea archaeon]
MILDTSVLVDIDRGRNLERIDRLPDTWHAISAATYMELCVGRYRNDVGKVEFEKIDENLEILPVTKGVADKAGQIFADLMDEGVPIEINDTYIAATAVIHGQPVLTNNADHFERVKHIEVVDWSDL